MNSYRNLPRRRHSTQLKREVLAACGEPGASIAAVALSFGLNANLVRQWRRGRGVKKCEDAATIETVTANGTVAVRPGQQRFIALAMPEPTQAKPCGSDVRIEARRGDLQVTVIWPSSSASDCALWLRELLR
ncbi:transposase [Ramlibacter sp. AN1015]|uniref:transposase n=1 Tax=Ramlibacter sp. AN1015 TaxID=3133428 RepID=UPI0030C15441